MIELNKALDKGTIIMKIERIEGCIQWIKDDIEFFGWCSEDYQRISELEKEIKQLKTLLPTKEQWQTY